VEELSQELKAARKELGRLHSLDQRVKDMLNDIKQIQADKDRYLTVLPTLPSMVDLNSWLRYTAEAQSKSLNNCSM